jgi:hypothetical protein
LHGAERAATAIQQEEEGRAAMVQASGLERRPLVEAGGCERTAGEPGAAIVPGDERGSNVPHCAIDHVGGQAVTAPRKQVPDDERPRVTATANAREYNHRRRRRRQHHRRRHRQPDPDEPAERSEVGAGAGIHSSHPLHERDPGQERYAEHGGGEREATG